MSRGDMYEEVFDQEWQTLLCTAREMGLTPEEIRAFFLQVVAKNQ